MLHQDTVGVGPTTWEFVWPSNRHPGALLPSFKERREWREACYWDGGEDGVCKKVSFPLDVQPFSVREKDKKTEKGRDAVTAYTTVRRPERL